MACPERSRRDPQIGKFLGVDPLAAGTFSLSPYMAMDNNPVSNVDPLGLRSSNYLDYRNGDGTVYNFMEEHMSRFSQGFRESMGYFLRSVEDFYFSTLEGRIEQQRDAGFAEGERIAGEKYSTPQSEIITVRLDRSVFTAGHSVAWYDKPGDGDKATAVGLSLAGKRAIGTGIEVALEVTAAGVGAGLMIAAGVLLPTAAHAPTTISYTTTVYHGNDKRNTNTSYVYSIYAIPGNNSFSGIQKFGITGVLDKPENRPQYQVNALNKRNDGRTYHYMFIGSYPNNATARMAELYHVSQYFKATGYKSLPPLQYRPNPAVKNIFLGN